MRPAITSPDGPVLRVRHGDSRHAEHRYIFDVLLMEHLGLQYEVEVVPGLQWVEIDMVGAPSGRALQVGANLLLRSSHQWLTSAAMPTLPLEQFDCQQLFPDSQISSVPVLFPAATGPEPSSEREKLLFLPLDIFGGAFFLLTRYEELIVKDRDQHERFSARDSLCYKAGCLLRPLVDEYAQLLRTALSNCFPGLKCQRHEARIRMSHDVDHPYQFFGRSVPQMSFAAGKWLFRHRTLHEAWRLALAGARSGFAGDVSSDPFNSYSSLMNAADALGQSSEFYFMAGQPRGRYEEAYDLNQPELQSLLREVHRRGHVIGLHASYSSFRSVEILSRERDCLIAGAKSADIELDSIGGRQHYLRWENPTTWRAWEKAGLAYDGTLGFAEHVGFRCGTSRDFPVFDALASKPLALRERPLSVMDVTLTDYMKLEPSGIIDLLQSIWATVRRVGGTMEVLIHNCNPQATWFARQVSSL